MTQMTFFDSPAFSSSATTAPSGTSASAVAAAPLAATVAPGADKNRVSSRSVEPISVDEPSPNGLGDGVQHMGDLARLVLLRYQLVAKRRAEMAGRRPR